MSSQETNESPLDVPVNFLSRNGKVCLMAVLNNTSETLAATGTTDEYYHLIEKAEEVAGDGDTARPKLGCFSARCASSHTMRLTTRSLKVRFASKVQSQNLIH